MWSYNGPVVADSLEEAVAALDGVRGDGYHERIGLEVEGLGHRAGERHTIAPAFHTHGRAPVVGEHVEVPGLGLASHWRVVAVAVGYPGRLVTTREPGSSVFLGRVATGNRLVNGVVDNR